MKLSTAFITASCVLLSTPTIVSSVETTTNVLSNNNNNNNDNIQLNDAKFVQFVQTSTLAVEQSMIESLVELRDEFVQWRKSFEKVYHSLEEEVERMMVWIKNHEFIHAHNNQTPKRSYTVGHNQFSDMTNDEFQQMHSLGQYSPGVDVIRAGQLKRLEEKAKQTLEGTAKEHPMMAEYRYLRSLQAPDDDDLFDDAFFNFDDTSDKSDDGGAAPTTTDDNDTNGLPDSIDWVKAGAVTPVKNQASCGSCWAFSSTGSIEGASFVKYGQLVALSEQQLMDCDTVDNGCRGGLMENAFKYDETAKGLCSETDYPYLATDGHECGTASCQKVNGTAVTDYIDIPEKDKHGLIAAIVQGPVSIAMEADQLQFQFYQSGVFDDSSCGASGAVDHGVLAVGYGTDAATNKTFFTVKNSWGDSWGENGYFNLARNSTNEWGTCAILMIMTSPIIA